MNKRLRKKKGVSKIRAEEVWSLDITIAKFIYPRLLKYKEINTMSYPYGFKNTEEWHEIVDKMIFSFEKIAKDSWVNVDSGIIALADEQKRCQEGIDLFAKYFISLWD